MATTIIRKWNDGDTFTVIYSGNGNGTAYFSSGTNEGVDRSATVTFRDTDGRVSVEKAVTQTGRREVFGDFILADGGTFNVIKHGL